MINLQKIIFGWVEEQMLRFLPFGVCHYENVTALFDCKIIDTPLKIDIDFQNTITQNLKKYYRISTCLVWLYSNFGLETRIPTANYEQKIFPR